MTHHTIITGKVPGQPGGCKAQHYLNSHSLNGYNQSTQHLLTPQNPPTVQNQFGAPYWGPQGGSPFPYYY